MSGWTACSTPSDRGCWLQNPTGANFTINTDYEADVPLGIVRPYTLVIGPNNTINVDGQVFPAAKVINGTYPGPWIQACWGDTVQVTVTVTNDAQFLNGTALHWHGIRQWLTMHMDGVPGVSQCPIAPGSTFVYEWRARQYGSSWYHSHYTLQYADGVLGALTIHGPSTAPYDEAGAPPLLLSDWDHTTAFQLSYGAPSNNPTILLSGVGDVQKTYNVTNKGGPTITTLNFTAGKRYLLRIINTSLGSSFLFTIDNHLLQVVTSDFVPIQPYKSESILVAIGQRYNVIVEAKPSTNPSGSPYPNPIPNDLNFWIRVYSIESEIFDTSLANANYNELGIIRYNNASINQPSSQPWNYSYQATSYYDETQLVPWVPWFIGSQSNAPGNTPEEHDVAIIPAPSRTQYPLAVFAIATPAPSPTPVQLVPFRIDWTNPMFQNLNMTSGWPDPWVVVAEDGTPDDWVYLLFENERAINHPLHLHGHDFAILSQSDQPYNSEVILKTFNPPRRDVVTLPAGGHVVIAFRTDNPGAWLMHCHIAFHASSGLALQVLENRQEAERIWPTGNSHALNVSQQLCDEWKAWVATVNQPVNPWFQDDSGI